MVAARARVRSFEELNHVSEVEAPTWLARLVARASTAGRATRSVRVETGSQQADSTEAQQFRRGRRAR